MLLLLPLDAPLPAASPLPATLPLPTALLLPLLLPLPPALPPALSPALLLLLLLPLPQPLPLPLPLPLLLPLLLLAAPLSALLGVPSAPPLGVPPLGAPPLGAPLRALTPPLLPAPLSPPLPLLVVLLETSLPVGAPLLPLPAPALMLLPPPEPALMLALPLVPRRLPARLKASHVASEATAATSATTIDFSASSYDATMVRGAICAVLWLSVVAPASSATHCFMAAGACANICTIGVRSAILSKSLLWRTCVSPEALHATMAIFQPRERASSWETCWASERATCCPLRSASSSADAASSAGLSCNSQASHRPGTTTIVPHPRMLHTSCTVMRQRRGGCIAAGPVSPLVDGEEDIARKKRGGRPGSWRRGIWRTESAWRPRGGHRAAWGRAAGVLHPGALGETRPL